MIRLSGLSELRSHIFSNVTQSYTDSKGREDWFEFIFVSLQKRILSYCVVKKRRLSRPQCISLQNLI